jgi:dihydropteridine reductase
MASAPTSSSSVRVLVYGGAGALGRAVVTSYKSYGASIDSVDFAANEEATNNFIVDSKFEESLVKVVKQLEIESAKTGGMKMHHIFFLVVGLINIVHFLYFLPFLKGFYQKIHMANKPSHMNVMVGALYDAIVCAAGGWAGGSLTGETHELLASIDKMYSMNLQSALATAHLAAKFLKTNGLVVLTGANAARNGTSGMIGYGLAKSATHQLAQSLHQQFSSAKTGSAVVSILPVTLDTPSNRSAMPNGNFTTWTPLTEVSGNIVSWTSQPQMRPASGSMLLVETKDSVTAWTPVHTEY